eukprot:TRINITY_DN1788_c2_g1_i1.p2 TRINITY_DN1788_c2_g1~~TRINITY_DN1788_c2_g1_i1.p2  ORF type:complete len:270 (-),score=66.35 TRINITY_DN1788_c2_g1_i1:1151-1960(-)
MKLSVMDRQQQQQQQQQHKPTTTSTDSDISSSKQSPDAAVAAAAGQHFNAGSAYLLQGLFLQGQSEMNNTIDLLLSTSSSTSSSATTTTNPYVTYQQELQFAVFYKKILTFLIELQRLQTLKLYQQMALVSKHLVQITTSVIPQISLFRIALKINFLVGNFTTSAQLIQLMATMELPEKEKELLKSMYDECINQQFVEKSEPLKPSPKLCFQTFRLIVTDAFDECEFCASSFRPQCVTRCTFCHYTLKRQSLSALLQQQQQLLQQQQQQ